MTEKIPALQFEEVDFEPEKEVWNVYELEDRSILKIRTILVKLLHPVKPTPLKEIPIRGKTPLEVLEFQAKFQNLMAVTKATPTLMGTPTPPVPLAELAQMEKVDVPYTPFLEDWNIYRLPDSNKIKVKLVVSSIFRVKELYDELGYPVYLVNSTNAIAAVPKPKPKP